ncbi:MAG: helix-turn-helix transcriptional regulator [Nitrospirae bacterium]|nr:helix-turn-helix transcriptional regulator [Candidatus Manganitrophaceae bacterium]
MESVSGGLTKREKEVLQLVAEGLTDQQLAEKFCLSIDAVQMHRVEIMNKLALRHSGQLVHYAVQKGYLNFEGTFS